MGFPLPGTHNGRVTVLRRVVIVLLLLAGVGAFVLAGTRTQRNGGADDVTISGGDDAVEALIPGRNAETLSQSEIGIDLADGWTGDLALNGVPIDDVQRVDALNQLLYRPPDGLDSRPQLRHRHHLAVVGVARERPRRRVVLRGHLTR